MKNRHYPIILTDKEIEAIQSVTAYAVVRAENGRGPKFPHLLSAVIKAGKARYERDIEIPAERLKILED